MLPPLPQRRKESEMAEKKCPECGHEFPDWRKVCPDCRTPLVKKSSIPQKSFPGTLWLLPIFFGIVGGVIAALIADMKYQASWRELLVLGIIISGVALLLYFALLFAF